MRDATGAPSKQAPRSPRRLRARSRRHRRAAGTHAPYAITAGPDGNFWFTEYQGDGIGQMTPYGATKRFPIDPDGFAERITAGPDGAVWFTDPVGNRIGRVAPDGKIAYVKLPHSDSGPAGITSGPDGNLWFTEHSGNRIGRLSTTGTLTEFELPKVDRPRRNRRRQRRQPVVRRGQGESHRARDRVRQRHGIRDS